MSDVVEHNVSTGEIITRDYTPEEIILNKSVQDAAEAMVKKDPDPSVVAAYHSTLAKLSALGLNNDEIATIMRIPSNAISDIQNS